MVQHDGYLKISNTGVFSEDAFLTLGVSTTRASNDSRAIGMFGSGTKQSICLFLRNGYDIVIYIGRLKLEFLTKDMSIEDATGSKSSFNKVLVRITGKSKDGKVINKTQDCGFVTEFGAIDWVDIGMGIREFVSNAVDASFEQFGDISGINVERVATNKVRAKSGETRVFIPLTKEVDEYFKNLSKHFLHFNDDVSLEDKLLEKELVGVAKIYRRGVIIGELGGKLPSVFDYNLKEVELDESRNVNPYEAAYGCAKALVEHSSASQLARALMVISDNDCWESEFSSFGLKYYGRDSGLVKDKWRKAWVSAFGDGAVLCSNATPQFCIDNVTRKGMRPVIINSSGWHDTLKDNGIKTFTSVLTSDEVDGRTVFDDVPQATTEIVDTLWSLLDVRGLTFNKPKPGVKTFSETMSAESLVMGFYRDDVVYINRDIADGNTHNLRQTILEELAHHITGATDNSRDFQDYCLRVAVMALMEGR